MTFERVQRAIAAFRAGRMVILVDDEDRENEGDLCFAAEKVTPELINFMARHARGLICLALTDEKLRQLDIPMMVQHNTSTFETAFTVSVEARHGVTTGISAADRATTILAAVNPSAVPSDLVRPGHIFPLRAQPGGVLVRTGQTEGVVDLARLAGLHPAGVICEVMKDDGEMARMPELEIFSKQHDIPILTVAELIEYRLAHESLVRRLVTRQVRHPRWGDVGVHVYGTTVNARQHLVITKGNVMEMGCDLASQAPLVRVVAGYPLTHVLDDVLMTPEGRAWHTTVDRVMAEREGVLICIDQGETTLPLLDRVSRLGTAASAMHHDASQGATSSNTETVLREVGIGAQILRDLGLSRIRVLTTHPKPMKGLFGYGLTVEDVITMETQS